MDLKGTLYLCATPIGNLEDVTLRVLRVLKEADEVWAEDTRVTRRLLSRYKISAKLKSCFEHNELIRKEELVALLNEGKSVAYCSDAGMPAISDPGAKLVEACLENNLKATVLPGASSVLAACVLSGFDCGRFAFYGFLPREKRPREELMHLIGASKLPVVLFESPKRLFSTLQELYLLLGEREAAVLRELTKVYEEARRAPLSELIKAYKEPPKGEIILVLAPSSAHALELCDEALDLALMRLLDAGYSNRDAVNAASLALNIPKKRLYSRTLMLKRRE